MFAPDQRPGPVRTAQPPGAAEPAQGRPERVQAHGPLSVEQMLRDSQERYRAFVANSSEGIWRMEFDPPIDLSLPPQTQRELAYACGRFAECNEAFARMYGHEHPDALTGQGLAGVLPPELPESRAYLDTVIRHGWRVSELESAERDRHGRPLHVANSLTGVVEGGHLVRAWGTQRDITKRKQAEAALREADQRKDEFLATLAHELRNPLAPIRNALEVLRRAGPQEPVLVRNRDMIGRQVGHLTRLIDDLLDSSRLTHGLLELRRDRVDLCELLRRAADHSRAELEAGGHTLRLELPHTPIHLDGDPLRLEQIVMNLLGNAVKYSPPGGPVWLRARAQPGGRAAVVAVRDAGIGIAAEHLPRIFDMFYQADRGINRARGGLGIGLSLARRLAQLHGGTLQAHSDGVGQGATFELRLPLPRAQAVAGAAGGADAPGAGATPAGGGADIAAAGGPLHVLVVDDNHDAADTLAEVLEIMGCRTATAYDGLEGVAKAEQLRPHAVVLDLGMPRLNGYEACQRIRSQPWGQGMRLVAVSGWGQQEDRRRSTEAGFDAHLVKPVAPDALLALLQGVR